MIKKSCQLILLKPKNSPYRLTASIFDEKYGSILGIDRNVISGKPSNADVIVKGGIITIKSLINPSITILKISLQNQPSRFEISELNMVYEGNQITINEGKLIVTKSNGGRVVLHDSDFTAKPSSNTFCIKIDKFGVDHGFGSY